MTSRSVSNTVNGSERKTWKHHAEGTKERMSENPADRVWYGRERMVGWLAVGWLRECASSRFFLCIFLLRSRVVSAIAFERYSFFLFVPFSLFFILFFPFFVGILLPRGVKLELNVFSYRDHLIRIFFNFTNEK